MSSWYADSDLCVIPTGRRPAGVLVVFERPAGGSKLGDFCARGLCGGDSRALSCATILPLPPVLAESWAGVYGELVLDVERSSLEATRTIGGSWGGKGEMGEPEA